MRWLRSGKWILVACGEVREAFGTDCLSRLDGGGVVNSAIYLRGSKLELFKVLNRISPAIKHIKEYCENFVLSAPENGLVY